jgi:hypothetical protein
MRGESGVCADADPAALTLETTAIDIASTRVGKWITTVYLPRQPFPLAEGWRNPAVSCGLTTR